MTASAEDVRSALGTWLPCYCTVPRKVGLGGSAAWRLAEVATRIVRLSGVQPSTHSTQRGHAEGAGRGGAGGGRDGAVSAAVHRVRVYVAGGHGSAE
eukprot:CAMPEP_0119364648 /NCGR_PEP_ID=MMETSP1334-20130426/11562_1 /TAXON_ID=127549 /ORGANISM="Calcidiscus leptoporus, Strain RCC1130" /LENGTH=96 /DNA_ID=CAMNT_0007380407 /DNA_START=485 /DNA_END=775 /DNA_ORIENTATION=+